MKATLKSIALIGALISFISSAAMASDIEDLLSKLERGNEDKTFAVDSSIRKLVMSDDNAAQTVLADVFKHEKNTDYRCKLIEILSERTDAKISKALAKTVTDEDNDIRHCATRAMALAKNDFATSDLITNVENYIKKAGRKHTYEDDLKARLSAIDSIWALGEIGSPKILKKLQEFYRESDEVLKINTVVSIGKLNTPESKPVLKSIANSAKEPDAVRAAAFEVLEEPPAQPAK